jgi:DNA-binding response OmpR family regulator
MRIQVVEDETKMADYLRKALTESGYAVEIALDGLDGQHLAQESEFDLIILDVMLPGLDGWQLLQIIRRKWQTPVLFLTARDSVDDRGIAGGEESNDREKR